MSIRVTCDSCDLDFKVSDNSAGRTVRCPECGDRVEVPDDYDEPEEPRSRPKRRGRRPQSKSRSNMGVMIAILVTAGIVLFAVIIGAVILVLHFSDDGPPAAQQAAGKISDISSKEAIALVTVECVTAVADGLKKVTDNSSAEEAAAMLTKETARIQEIHLRMRQLGRASSGEQSRIRKHSEALKSAAEQVRSEANRIGALANSGKFTEASHKKLVEAAQRFEDEVAAFKREGDQLNY